MIRKLLIPVRLMVLVPLLISTWLIASCAAARTPLNSEMINAKFGSYGVQILRQSGQVRVSSLYSVSDGLRTTRTFALVLFPTSVPQGLLEAHEKILAGESLGATLVTQGWQLAKHPLGYRTVGANAELAMLMQVAPDTPLATHLYSMTASRGSESVNYVQIAEIHHPSHLDTDGLQQIYGTQKSDEGRKLRHEALLRLTWQLDKELQIE